MLVRNFYYSPLLPPKLNIQWCEFVGQCEPIHQVVRTCLPSRYLYHLLDKLGDLEGVRIRLAFLRVGTYDSLSINLLKCATEPHRLQILPALIPLLVVAKAVQYINTSYDYYNAQVSMGKAAVHCTSTQSLHCETRNKSIQIVSPRTNLESRCFMI